MTTMYATYEQALRGHFRNQMIEDAEVTPSGKEATVLTWTVGFTERSSYEFALNELDRLGLDRWAIATPSRLTIIFPRSLDREGQKLDPFESLGLTKPKTA